MNTDHLVIGAGIAGLSHALYLADLDPQARILLVSKVSINESNTQYAQGGIAAVMSPEDNLASHVADTLRAGDYATTEEVVRGILKCGPEIVEDLTRWGVRFDRNDQGQYHLVREGGHSHPRILHYKDYTGKHLQETLAQEAMRHPQIELMDHWMLVDLWLDEEKTTCLGGDFLALSTQEFIRVSAQTTALCTGGVGALFPKSSNPKIATGDGIAIARKNGVRTELLSYVQFHPTVYSAPDLPPFLISEALRGHGALLRDINGHRFMPEIDDRAELAPRDVVSRGILAQMNRTEASHVWLDATGFDPSDWDTYFPSIYAQCLRYGIDPSQAWIPVAPMAHYLCGGIDVDVYGRTSLDRLYALGECSHTGLHGANRLASNSLTEAVAVAKQAAQHALTLPKNTAEQAPAPQRKLLQADLSGWKAHVLTLQQELMEVGGVVKSQPGLEALEKKLTQAIAEFNSAYPEGYTNESHASLSNILSLIHAMVLESIAETRNQGVFYKSAL